MPTIELSSGLPVSDLPPETTNGVDEHARLAALARYRIVDTVPEQAYDDVVDIAASLIQASVVLLTLMERDRQWFKAKLGTDLESVSLQKSMCRRLISHPDGVLLIEDTQQDPWFMNSDLAHEQSWIRFYIGAALVTHEGHVIGSLCLFDSVPRQVSPQQVNALACLARQTMHLLELRLRHHEIRDLLSERSVQMQELSMQQVVLQKQNQHLHLLSLTDGLTGLLNRGGLDQHLVKAYAMAKQQQQPLSLLLMDVDYFKSYNDQFGHPAGDEVLRQIGGILQRICRRRGDIAARYGGEEFMLILPNTPKKAAQTIAHRVCSEIAKTRFVHRALTLSVGVATLPDLAHDLSINTLVEQADNALYRAKQLGRNQVAVA